MPIVETESSNELTPLEEKVIRMHHGISEGDDFELSFAVGASSESIAQLAHMEKYLLDKFYPPEEEEE